MEDNENYSIVLFSGTVDKLLAAVTLVSGAAAMGKKVNLFLTYWGVVAFRKGDWKTNRRFSKDFEDYAGPAFEAMQVKNVPPWLETLQVAMELGDVSVKACAATMDMFDIKLEDLEPVVSEVTGVASFIGDSEGGTTLFI
jgi:peroxiredoxin family protein